MMSKRQDEILTILQEECAEVIQAISKVRRFGKDTNMEDLCKEIADCEYLIRLAKINFAEMNSFNWGGHEEEKTKKLLKYSSILTD